MAFTDTEKAFLLTLIDEKKQTFKIIEEIELSKVGPGYLVSRDEIKKTHL